MSDVLAVDIEERDKKRAEDDKRARDKEIEDLRAVLKMPEGRRTFRRRWWRCWSRRGSAAAAHTSMQYYSCIHGTSIKRRSRQVIPSTSGFQLQIKLCCMTIQQLFHLFSTHLWNCHRIINRLL